MLVRDRGSYFAHFFRSCNTVCSLPGDGSAEAGCVVEDLECFVALDDRSFAGFGSFGPGDFPYVFCSRSFVFYG